MTNFCSFFYELGSVLWFGYVVSVFYRPI